MTHEEAVKLGMDMFYDGKSPAEIKRQIGLKGFSELECANIFRMIEEKERISDNFKQSRVREHEREVREKKMEEIKKAIADKKAKEAKEDDYTRTRDNH